MALLFKVTAAALVFVALFLFILVFLQNPKDEGGADVFGAGAVKKMVGASQAAHFLKSLTYFFITLLYLLGLTLAVLGAVPYGSV